MQSINDNYENVNNNKILTIKCTSWQVKLLYNYFKQCNSNNNNNNQSNVFDYDVEMIVKENKQNQINKDYITNKCLDKNFSNKFNISLYNYYNWLTNILENNTTKNNHLNNINEFILLLCHYFINKKQKIVHKTNNVKYLCNFYP